MTLLRYISHPDVEQDPQVLVPNWSLNDVGRRRAQAMLNQQWVPNIGRVISSAETKALQTAATLGQSLSLEIEVRPSTGEVDRSATGYVSGERHDQLSQRLFAEPAASADGWETAHDAQARVSKALADLLAPPDAVDTNGDAIGSDVVVVGHGGVGTLLLCELAGLEIEQLHDQPGQGHFWTFDRSSKQVLHRWHPIDNLAPPI